MNKDTASFPDLIDITEASKILGLTSRQLQRLSDSGKIKAIQLTTRGKRMYYKKAIEEFGGRYESR